MAGNVRGLLERLESALRAAVQDGRLIPGAALPPSRTLAAYLGRVRGVATTAERLLICSGFTQGLTLTCRALRRRGARRVAVEDPCFGHHREAIALTGLEPVPVTVGPHGLDPAQLPADA